MQLSVIIPCLNAADTIATQLEALAGQSWSEPWEVIVADNGSTDDSRAIVEQYQGRLPNLRIVDASARRGQPFAVNMGVKAARGAALLICDADDEVAPGWLAVMGDALLSTHDFVACRVDIEKLNAPWVQATIKDHPQQYGLQKIAYPPYLPHAGGGTIGVKRSLYEAVGGFDESLPCLHDTDFCFKLQLTGIKLHFLPDAVLHIRCRGELGGVFQQARSWAEYSVLLYKKYQQLSDVKVERPWSQYMRRWKGLLWRLPQICHKAGRATWVRSLGWQIGRLQGSLKHRVAPF